MERESEYLLHLLGCYLRRTQPRALADVNWENMMTLSHIHGVTGVISYMAYTHRLCQDAQTHEAMRSLCTSTVFRFGHRGTLADVFLDQLAANGIDHICMKGYVLRDYYPVPELRTFGDVDLVIRPADRQKCHKLLLELGYQAKTDWEPVFTYHRQQEKYEVHTELLEVDVSDRADYRAYFRNMWAHVRSTGAHRYELTPEFHFLYLLTHIAKHIHGSGAGVRLYMDLAAFILHFGDSIDWDWIAGELAKLRLLKFGTVVMSAVRKWFGVPCPISFSSVSETVLDEFTRYTLEAGVFGHHQRECAMSAMKNNASETGLSRFRFFLRRLFPPVGTLQKRYTYLQKCPWLLPFAWVHRLIITRGSLRAHTHEAQVIFSAESEEIRRLRRITKNIGL